MYTPAAAPASLAEMLDFLSPMVTDGLFDSVAYDNDSSPTKIICTQNSHTILEITLNGSSWTFKPFVADGTAGSPSGRVPAFVVSYLMRCKGGALFSAVNYGAGATATGYNFIIGKSTNGKTAFLACQSSSVTSPSTCLCFVTCFGDNMANSRYTSGFNVIGNGLSQDRTNLQQIPVWGAVGSTDCFETVYFRNTAQFMEAGRQTIDEKSYGCAGYWAILDE